MTRKAFSPLDLPDPVLGHKSNADTPQYLQLKKEEDWTILRAFASPSAFTKYISLNSQSDLILRGI